MVFQGWRVDLGLRIGLVVDVDFEFEFDAIQTVEFPPAVAVPDHKHNHLHYPSRHLRNLLVWLQPISW